MAFIARKGASGFPAAGATIHVYAAGTTNHVTGLKDLDGNAIDNTAGFAVPAPGDFWGFVPADRSKLDVYWAEGNRNLVEDAILRDIPAPTAATAGAVLSSDGSADDWAAIPPQAIILLNHDGMIKSRAVASNADDTYGCDRWNILTQTGAIAVSQLADTADGTPYMMRHTQSQATAQRFGTEQIVESTLSRRLRGKNVTVAAKHKISANGNLRLAALEWTGTADAVTSDVVNSWTSGTYTAGNFFLGANLTVRAVSDAIASTAALATDVLSFTVGSSCNNLIILAWTEGAVDQNVTLDLAIDAMIGAVAKEIYAFPLRSYVEERDRCSAYGLPVDSVVCGLSVTAQNLTNSFPFPVEMRVPPTLLGATFSVNTGNAGTVGATNTTKKSTYVYNADNNWTVNALVLLSGYFDAEL